MTDSEPKDEVQSVRLTSPPSATENHWFEYAEQLPFASDGHLARFADKLLSLNTALIAAYIAAISLAQKPLSWILLIPLSFFIVSLASALYSIFPRSADSEYFDIHPIRERYLSGLKRRRLAVSLGLVTYFLGILTGIVAVFLL